MSTTIRLAHGGGGRLTRDLIEQQILPRFGNGPLAGLPDSATLNLDSPHIAFTTDSFVVQPLIFPGGNIGSLAVHGTVNDLAVAGARPRWLSLGIILEEGLPMETLETVLDSVAEAARSCGVKVATGDTKVVPHGLCDGMYLNTAGIGERLPNMTLSPDTIKPGDKILASGTLGDHGFAILAARNELALQHGPTSDSAPVHRLVQTIEEDAPHIRFMRDPTRGGAAGVLSEIAAGASLTVALDEARIPLSDATRATSELVGIEPIHMACEGRILAVCSSEAANRIVDHWRKLPEGRDACIIGTVESGSPQLLLNTLSGAQRLVTIPRGDLLPRIC